MYSNNDKRLPYRRRLALVDERIAAPPVASLPVDDAAALDGEAPDALELKPLRRVAGAPCRGACVRQDRAVYLKEKKNKHVAESITTSWHV
jgi:hypothetical protein